MCWPFHHCHDWFEENAVVAKDPLFHLAATSAALHHAQKALWLAGQRSGWNAKASTNISTAPALVA